MAETERDTGFPWIAEVHRDRDGEILGRGTGLSWADALRNILSGIPFSDEPWTLTLRDPQGADARFKTRAGVMGSGP
ncbi:hypothetical protein FHR32_007745 [Streptosporangium album]|uniref:Uncharacterized protein n=1 Tax=Streptosporangium album TaxID=47479 RepID=A0A7W7S3P5_9ACTN|nr:hypothetical protein [Streptosporangium album]MBB4943345.1 hypothetical protein [Streptosporangium album]